MAFEKSEQLWQTLPWPTAEDSGARREVNPARDINQDVCAINLLVTTIERHYNRVYTCILLTSGNMLSKYVGSKYDELYNSA